MAASSGYQLGEAFKHWLGDRSLGWYPAGARGEGGGRKQPAGVEQAFSRRMGQVTTFAHAIATQASGEVRKRFEELRGIGGHDQAVEVLARRA